ncbi:MAG: VOC family protein [Bacteroidales bacterium]|jgi:predicted enzyme related to lactoylglutathione lyase|nr:VOC family protein [Bacteroidales bacterium]
MKSILFIGILIFGFQTGFSQQNTEQTDRINNMEKQSILGLRTTIYKVEDIHKAKKWYAKAFGTEPYFDEPFYVGFNIGGYELGLLPEENPTTDKPESVLTYWGVNEIEKVYKHFLESGAIENEKPHSVGEPIIVASVKDPWGNVIGLIYNPVFKLK